MGGRMVDGLIRAGGHPILKHVSPLPAVGLYLVTLCPNGDLDNSKYASPMPTIGLYIAFGTLVCFLCMLFDLCYGFYRRRPWLPCKLFSMNSFTMTLLSIATKLSVDMNTSMPRAIEQLSKLTSTAFLCISMGFLMPSLATSRTSESVANLASLGVLVVTVVVNVSIQISTGVIFSFIVEHVILLICMSVLLALLCASTLYLNYMSDTISRSYTEVAKNTPSECGLKGMRKQLEHFYPATCCLNPQFVCCETSYCSSVGLLCCVVVAVVIEAVLRSLAFKELRFCNGVSDYKWSVGWVIVIHILTIIVGAFVVCFRWLIVVSHRSVKLNALKDLLATESVFSVSAVINLQLNPLHFGFYNRFLKKLCQILKYLIKTWVLILNLGMLLVSFFIIFLCLLVKRFFSLLTQAPNCEESVHSEVGIWSVYDDLELAIWKLGIARKNMKRLMEASKRDTPTHIIALLSKTFSPTPLHPQSLLSIIQRRKQDDFKVTAISQVSMIVLTKIATHCIPNFLSDPLKESLNEALELISFVENKMKGEGLGYKVMVSSAKYERFSDGINWKARDIIDLTDERNTGNSAIREVQEGSLDRALLFIEKVRDSSENGRIQFEICDSILENRNVYESITELYEHIEQAFIDILRLFLNDLPIAIFREYSETTIEEAEARVGRAIKFMCMLELLEDKVTLSSWPDHLDINKRNPPSTALPITATENTVDKNPLPLPLEDAMSQEIQSANPV